MRLRERLFWTGEEYKLVPRPPIEFLLENLNSNKQKLKERNDQLYQDQFFYDESSSIGGSHDANMYGEEDDMIDFSGSNNLSTNRDRIKTDRIEGMNVFQKALLDVVDGVMDS